jgi:hypothetical protein
LLYRAGNGEEYDEALLNAVKKFQADQGYVNGGGIIGPGTRARLVTALLRKFGAPKFSELDASQGVHVPTVFLSYAWGDSQRVNKLDQWLRDRWSSAPLGISSSLPSAFGIAMPLRLCAWKEASISTKSEASAFWEPVKLELAHYPARDYGAANSSPWT